MSKGTKMDMATAVKERPMIFGGPMVKAILESRKTQTRRVVKPQPPRLGIGVCMAGDQVVCQRRPGGPVEGIATCPYGQPGDRLWVRETFRRSSFTDQDGSIRRAVEYRADGAKMHHSSHLVTQLRNWAWLSPIHMPRWAARITLEITDVRVERVQEISESDCYAEGIPEWKEPGQTFSPAIRFRELWDSINAVRGFGWEANPWTWAISFKRLKP